MKSRIKCIAIVPLVVVGVAVDHAQAVATYARELKIPYPLLVGEQDALDAAVHQNSA